MFISLLYLIGTPFISTLIQRLASHRFVFDIGDLPTGADQNYHPFSGYAVDSRFIDRVSNLITVHLPSPGHSSRLFFPPRQVLPLQPDTFISRRPAPYLKAEWFLRWGRDLPARF